jgi:hypothetical protein
MIPPLTFYVLLARSLTGLPIMDDYDLPLGFLLQWKKESGIKHILEVLTYQHNEYRLIFENAIFGLQYVILGHTNLKALSIFGDLFVIPLFGILYLIWRDCGRPRDYTLLAFVPVSWILFQLQYASALSTAMTPLQHIPVIVFALLTCFLATKASRMAFLGTLLSLLLCIASSANGLFMILIGIAIYLQRRQYKRLVTWCILSAASWLVYFHGYNITVSMPIAHADNNIVSLLQHLSLVYAAAFLGSIATIANPLPAILFCLVLVGVFIFATRDRLFVRRPALYYSSLFFFVTGLAVSGLRSSHGLATALGSRYRINSTVLLILLYLYLADKFYGIRVRPLILRAGACIVGVLLLGFNYESDRGGEKLILTGQHKLEVAMLRWERHEPRPPISASSADDFTAENEIKGFYEPNEPILSESIREGIYKLPKLSTGN